MRPLVVDCQILQTAAYERGMGKYAASLLEAFLKINRKQKLYKSVTLLLSTNLDASKKRLSSIKKQFPDCHTALLDLPTHIATDTEIKYGQATARIDSWLKKELGSEAVDFLITAPFFVGFPAVFPSLSSVRKYSLVYDFIPHDIWHLQRIFPDDLYARHFEVLLQADRLFTISNAVRNNMIETYGFPANKIISIDGGPFVQVVAKTKKTKLKQPYVLMPSAPIVHKNNLRGVRAFAAFNKRQNNAYTLYITSTFDKANTDELQKISDKVMFTGNLSEADLVSAYQGASTVYFPSLAEGLGMPVLEATLYGVPAACSSIPVLRELSEDAFYMFDPTDEPAMASSLEQAANKVEWQKHKKAGEKVVKTYTWQRSAEILVSSLQENMPKHQEPSSLKLIGPRPNRDTPAANLLEQLYAGLRQRYNIEVLFTDSKPSNKPSYLAYLPRREAKAPAMLTIKSGKSDLFRRSKRAVHLKMHSADGHKQKAFSLSGKKLLKDKALQQFAWHYTDKSGATLTAAEIIKRLS